MLPKEGDRVRMTGVMANDPSPLPVGLEGTVLMVSEFDPGSFMGTRAQIHVDWDADEAGHKRTLSLLAEDPYEIVRS